MSDHQTTDPAKPWLRPGESPIEWGAGFLASLDGDPRDDARSSEWLRGWTDGESTKEKPRG